jgi:hypothetical protein
VPSANAIVPTVASMPLHSGPSALSTERAYSSTGVFPSIIHITMSSACVPEITIGEIRLGSLVRR